MVENTKIQWATHTLNWWVGCEAISPGCLHCYAASWAKRAGRDFAVRTLTTQANRTQPIKWASNHETFYQEHGHRQRVFTNSLADVFDNQVPDEWRTGLFNMIKATVELDYLILTKRVGNISRMLPTDWGLGYPNVWIGISVVNQEEADRDIPKLLKIPAAIRFLSCEPLLSRIDLTPHLCGRAEPCEQCPEDADCECGFSPRADLKDEPAISWVIGGGESGSGARPCALGWLKDIVHDCKNTGTPVFIKQLGAKPTNREGEPCPHIHARKGDDMAEWSPELRVREFPVGMP